MKSESPSKPQKSAEHDDSGKEYLDSTPWKTMGMNTKSSKGIQYFDKILKRVAGDMSESDLYRVVWLSTTLFFVVGGYWLLRSLKDPIMSVIDGVSYSVCSHCLPFRLSIFHKQRLHPCL